MDDNYKEYFILNYFCKNRFPNFFITPLIEMRLKPQGLPKSLVSFLPL